MKREEIIFVLICNIAQLIISYILLLSDFNLSITLSRGLPMALLVLIAMSIGTTIKILMKEKSK